MDNTTSTIPIRQQILEEAARLTTTDRNTTHGHPVKQHRFTAKLWNVYLQERTKQTVRAYGDDLEVPREISADDVAIMMALVKISRHAHGEKNADNFIDAAAYLAIAGECAEVTL